MADIRTSAYNAFYKTCTIFGQAQGHLHTAADMAKGPLKLAKAVKEVSGEAIKGFSAISPSLEGLCLVDDLTGPIAIVADLVKWNNGDFKNWAQKARATTLIAIRSLGFTSALSKLGAVDLSKISATVGKIPYAGETLSRFNIGAIIQPFLMAMYTFDIADQGMKLTGNSTAIQRAKAKKEAWSQSDFDPTNKVEHTIKKPDGKEEKIQLSHFDVRSIKKKVPAEIKDGDTSPAAEIADKKTGRTFQEHIDWKTNTYQRLSNAEKQAFKDRKVAKWEAKIDSARMENRKAWISIAIDVLKIAGAALTLALLTTAVVTTFPAFAAVTATVVGVAALAKLGKVFYDFHHAQVVKENMSRMAPVRMA